MKKEEIIFPEGSTLLSGDIGSGKTTVLLAIEFAYSAWSQGKKAVRSWEAQRWRKSYSGVCHKRLECKNRKNIKAHPKSITQDSAIISIDDERFEGSVTEVKNKVLNLLNYPAEFAKKTNLLYKFTVYTPQEEMKSIILEPGDTRLNTLRHVFGIDKYKRIEENACLFTSKLREK